MSDEQIQQKVEQARKLMVKGIKSQMKIRSNASDHPHYYVNCSADSVLSQQWKPSCKEGTAKFSYSGALPSARIFNEVMGQPAASTKKMVSFTPSDFVDIADDDSTASVRYNTLRITGTSVNVKWKEDEGAFSVNGSYGL